MPEGKDPDEFIKTNGAAKFGDLLQKADTPAAFQIAQLRKQFSLTDEAQKIEFVEACTKVISSVTSSVERDVLRQRLANETGIGGSAIEAEVEKKRRRQEKVEKRKISVPQPKAGTADKSHTVDKIISLCLKDRSVFLQYKSVLEEEIQNSVHRKILELMRETDDAAQIALQFTDNDAAVAAKALNMPVNYENNSTAMQELIRALQKESHNRKVKEAIESGDLTRLNALLMKNKEKEEGGR